MLWCPSVNPCVRTPITFANGVLQVTSDARPKRIATSTRRTTAWLEACLELHSKHQQQQQQQQGQGDRPQQQAGQGGPDQRPHEGDGLQATVGGGEQGSGLRLESGPVPGPLSGSIVLAALGGGAVEAERARAAKAVAEKEGVGGGARGRGHMGTTAVRCGKGGSP